LSNSSGNAGKWATLNRQIIECERCPRLRNYCRRIAQQKRRAFAEWDYWGRPLPNFGDRKARLLVIGLAPAAHGGNRTGRMFTGDRSGDWLYKALFKAGFANQPHSVSIDDGLQLIDCAITAAVHCAPPDNKPTPRETANCQAWLNQTVDLLNPRVMLALGQIGFRAAVAQAKRRGWYSGPMPKFGHGALVELKENRWLLASYHPSQQNTFTGKLTEAMLDRVFTTARKLLAAN
jgi:uracil-DNA glycosylase